MNWFYRGMVRPVLFSQDPEIIHNRTLAALGWMSRQPAVCGLARRIYGAPAGCGMDVLGLHFPNPVGLAAGMDKLAEAVPAWEALGFGFSELGGVTWQAQPGNPQPRAFRVISEGAIINRMGFNNPGAEAVAAHLETWKRSGRWPAHPVGMNLGKSKITPLSAAAGDYAKSFQVLWPWLDFFVVNVSSPNTPNLRELQDRSALDEILAALQEAQASRPAPKPILVKVAPDLTFEALDQILELAGPRRLAGIVATNTTITRPSTVNERLRLVYNEVGGLSGRPLRDRSTEIVRHLYRQTQGRLPIIGVGGIFNAADAWEKIVAGASLVQVYTGMVYEGPGLARAIVRGLRQRLAAAGLKELREAVGREA